MEPESRASGTAAPEAPREREASGGTDDSSPNGSAATQGANVPQIVLSRTPQLAPNVKLSGPMQESAFKDPPYLIERDGQFIQTPELLYRIAEQIDGRRTVDEIAERASEATKIELPPDETKQLLAKLFTIGVITDANNKLITDIAPQVAADGYSPLALNMRMAMIGPKLLHPITTVLRVFHWPPVLLALLVTAAVAHWWLYFDHGIGAGVHEALYTPGLMLALMGLIILAAVFHEFGHASALEYGGGKVKNMGVGLYMIYPAFYTDVTDSYRLPRWSRVRTDLGGLYFNLLFTLLLIGIYWVTGAEFLLLVVALINFEMVHQLLPLGRLDGYWTLADLTGVPDFFSRIVPFLRSVLPRWVPLPEGQKLPELKAHAKVAFAAYIILAIPLLLFLLFMMVRAVPRILATAVDAFIEQISLLEDAANNGDMLNVAGTIVQMAILLLMLTGIFYLLFKLGQRMATTVWAWSKPSWPRRLFGAAGSALMVLLLAFLWAPQLPIPGEPSGPAYNAVSFEPIRKGERLSVRDAARQSIVVKDPQTGQFREVDPAQVEPGSQTGPVGTSGQDPGQSSGGAVPTGGSNQTGPTPDTQGGVPVATPRQGAAGTRTPTPEATLDPTPVPSPTPTLEPTPTPTP